MTYWVLRRQLRVKRLVAILIFLCPHITLAEGWSDTTGSPGIVLNASVERSGSRIKVAWFENVVPGDELFTLADSREIGTFYERYKFLGIIGESVVIGVTGASQIGLAQEATSDGSFDKKIYVPKNFDGNFSVVPSSLIGLGRFELTRHSNMKGVYKCFLRKVPN